MIYFAYIFLLTQLYVLNTELKYCTGFEEGGNAGSVLDMLEVEVTRKTYCIKRLRIDRRRRGRKIETRGYTVDGIRLRKFEFCI